MLKYISAGVFIVYVIFAVAMAAMADTSVIDLQSKDYEDFSVISVSLDENKRNLDENWHGDLDILTSAATLASLSNINVVNGISKILVVPVAGIDSDGTFTISGTSVDRNTQNRTTSDTEDIVVSGLATDNTYNDVNSNQVHLIEDAYISSKWWFGAIVLSTSDVNLSDVDVYSIMFEQFNDKPDVVLTTMDCTTEITNTAAWLDMYLYKVDVTGSRADIDTLASIELTVGDSAVKPYRFRELLNTAVDGLQDGIWVDTHFGPNSQNYFINFVLKVWASRGGIVGVD